MEETKTIRLSDCKDKHLYQIEGASSDIGVFIRDKRAFVVKIKGGGGYGLIFEYHKDVGADVGKVSCVAELEPAMKFDWDKLSLAPQYDLMMQYLDDAEKRHDIEFKRVSRLCKQLNENAIKKSNRPIGRNILLGWCRGDKKLLERVSKDIGYNHL